MKIDRSTLEWRYSRRDWRPRHAQRRRDLINALQEKQVSLIITETQDAIGTN